MSDSQKRARAAYEARQRERGVVQRSVRLSAETWQMIGEIARARGLTYPEVIEEAVRGKK